MTAIARGNSTGLVELWRRWMFFDFKEYGFR